MTETKNILLIGSTESGKSTLGNVLINRNDNFEEVFTENGWTEETKIEEVEIEGTKYRIIDTVGWDWGDNTSPQQILTELAQNFQAAEGKIDRILLLMKGRGDWNNVVTAFKSLKNLDSELLKHITIVWSNFVEFEEKEKCEENDRRLKKITDQKIVEVVEHLPFIYVNNSLINTSISQREGETEEDFQRRKEEQERNKERRKSSRRIVLDHLKENCQETYHVGREKIANFLNAHLESSEAKTEKTTVTETRNILLIGGSGKGKSALANTLVNEDGNFTKIFDFNNNSGSTTKTTQKKEVEIEGDNYRIIDTVSLDHTSMNKQKVASELNKSFRFTEGKINQILLMVSGFFDRTSCLTYRLIKEIAPELLDYTTIVITRFSSFANSEACGEDIEFLRNPDHVNPEVLEITRRLPIIHIDNSQDLSFDLKKSENETEESFQKRKELRERINEENKEKRKLSRQRLLDRLKDCQKIYQLENMTDLGEKISNFLVPRETIRGFGKDREKTDQRRQIAELEERVKIAEKEKKEREKLKQEMEKKIQQRTAELEGLGKGNKKKGSGGILFFIIIIVVIGIIGCLWPTKKEKKT